MKQTENHKLNKPDYTDVADIADINANMDIIDANLGRVTTPAYTDTKGNKYTDINGMHLRTDNAIYAKGGIKIVNVDPCADGRNLTEEMVSGTTVNLYVLAKIDENGNAVFKELEASSLDVDSIKADKAVIDGMELQELAFHFSKAKGALYTDNSSKNGSDGSRKFILGVYKDTPKVDENLMPTSFPNAGIVSRVESDANGNGTYVELYGLNIVCRTDNAVFKVPTVKADTIRAEKELKIGSSSVAEMIGAKADADHSHTLTDESIEGTLPLSKGGTGATTATGARTNLGLGTAATKGVSTTIASGGTNLVTSGAVYSAINNLNINNRTHIVLAAYDTKNPLKANADYTCTSTNASSVLKTAINAVALGGTVELLDGTYNLQYDEDAIELTKAINIVGSGHTTTIHQPFDEAGGEAKPIFIISGQNVRLKGMMLCDKNVTSPVAMIEQQTQGAIYDDVFFIFNAAETSSYGACIKGSNDCNYTRIQNCRVYKGFNNSGAAMFDFSGCTGFGGVIGANISSGYNNISVKFTSESHKNNTAVYGHKAIDLLTE
jgi:hypothetical protein|nr:MAG TPA: Protein of unknown function (DUF1565) [Caudoviricetes sp.]